MPLEMCLFIVKQNVLEAQKRSRATSDKRVCHLDLGSLQLSVLVREKWIWDSDNEISFLDIK